MKKWLILVVGLFILIYLPTIPQDFFSLDDNALIFIPQLGSKSLMGLRSLFLPGYHVDYYPLRDLSYLLDIYLGDFKPWAFRVQNLCWALSVFFMLLGLAKIWQKPLGLSLAIASFWLLHPIHLETVVWISARKDLIALGGALASFYFFVRYYQKPGLISAASVICCLLVSFLSKASFILYPFVIFIGILLLDRKKIFLPAVMVLIATVCACLQSWIYADVNDMSLSLKLGDRLLLSTAGLGKMMAGLILPWINVLETENNLQWLGHNRFYVRVGFAVWILWAGCFVFSVHKKKQVQSLWLMALLALYLPISGLIFPHRHFYSVRYIEPVFLCLIVWAISAINSVSFLKGQKSLLALVFLCVYSAGFLIVNANDWSSALDIRKKSLMSSPKNAALKLEYFLELEKHIYARGSLVEPHMRAEFLEMQKWSVQNCEDVNHVPTYCANYLRFRTEQALDQNNKELAWSNLQKLNQATSHGSMYRKAFAAMNLDWQMRFLSVAEIHDTWPSEVSANASPRLRLMYWAWLCFKKEQALAQERSSFYLKRSLLERSDFKNKIQNFSGSSEKQAKLHACLGPEFFHVNERVF